MYSQDMVSEEYRVLEDYFSWVAVGSFALRCFNGSGMVHSQVKLQLFGEPL